MATLLTSLDDVKNAIAERHDQLKNITLGSDLHETLIAETNVLIQRKKVLEKYGSERIAEVDEVNANIDDRIKKTTDELEGERKERLSNIDHNYEEKVKELPELGFVQERSRNSSPSPLSRVQQSLQVDSRPDKLDVILSSPVSEKEALLYAWNPDDCSPVIHVMADDPFTFTCNLCFNLSTYAIRGKKGYSHGFHVWEIVWPYKDRGSPSVVGVATKDTPLQHDGYTPLIGMHEGSFGLDLKSNTVHHNSKKRYYPNQAIGLRRYGLPDSFYVILDMDDGCLSFATESQYLGRAFTGLKGKTLYPAASATIPGNVKMRYIGGL